MSEEQPIKTDSITIPIGDVIKQYSQEEFDKFQQDIENIIIEEEQKSDEEDEIRALINVTIRLEEIIENMMSEKMRKYKKKMNYKNDEGGLIAEFYRKEI